MRYLVGWVKGFLFNELKMRNESCQNQHFLGFKKQNQMQVFLLFEIWCKTKKNNRNVSKKNLTLLNSLKCLIYKSFDLSQNENNFVNAMRRYFWLYKIVLTFLCSSPTDKFSIRCWSSTDLELRISDWAERKILLFLIFTLLEDIFDFNFFK